MRSYAKVFTLLCLLVGSALAAGDEGDDATTLEMMEKQTGDPESSPQEEENSETKEKRGLFRVTGVLGENQQPYPLLYTVPKAAATPAQYDPRTAGAAPVQAYARPYPFPQPAYQQPLVLPSAAAAPATPFPYGATPMILLMMPPHPGNPYGSLMIVPANNIFPQYTPNHIPFPYQAASRLPVQLVPQYVPVPAKGVAAAHYKGSEYQQKPLSASQASVYQSYQDTSSSEEMDQSSAPSPSNYGTRQQYVKG